jgi:YbgC/YbaW family acyl-CoA thioester hydrolase
VPGEIFTLPIPSLRLGEFDIGGVLYHAHYFHLYEITREAFLAAGGCSYPSLVSRGQHLAVVESHQKFSRPIRYGETLTVLMTMRNIKKATAEFVYQVHVDGSAPETPAHEAWTRHVLVEAANSRFEVTGFPAALAAYFHRFSPA